LDRLHRAAQCFAQLPVGRTIFGTDPRIFDRGPTPSLVSVISLKLAIVPQFLLCAGSSPRFPASFPPALLAFTNRFGALSSSHDNSSLMFCDSNSVTEWRIIWDYNLPLKRRRTQNMTTQDFIDRHLSTIFLFYFVFLRLVVSARLVFVVPRLSHRGSVQREQVGLPKRSDALASQQRELLDTRGRSTWPLSSNHVSVSSHASTAARAVERGHD
jgi:hypothetical protein